MDQTNQARCPRCGTSLLTHFERELARPAPGDLLLDRGALLRSYVVAEGMGECPRHGVVRTVRTEVRP